MTRTGYVYVTMSLIFIGHTKCSCRWCFGLLKRTFRRMNVSCLEDNANVVTVSSTAGVNVGQEDDTVPVPMHYWTTLLASYSKEVQDIKCRRHFYFEADTAGVATRDFCDTESTFQDLLKGGASELCPATAPLGTKPAKRA